jgi:hypothetical protein
VPNANTLTVDIMVMVAKDEGLRISARKKAALAAAEVRGTKLGGNRGVEPTMKMRIQSAAARQHCASARAADIAPPIAALQADGATSLRQIAAGLRAKDIPTARGEGAWTAPQVKRVLKRLVR